MIVFCDGCNSGYHQYCHHPPIEREVVQVAEKEWFCAACAASKKKQDDALPNFNDLIPGVNLSREEVGLSSALKPQYILTKMLETSLLLNTVGSKAHRAIAVCYGC